MPLIPSFPPPPQAHTSSAPANALPPSRSPGRLDIATIENRLFGAPGDAPRHAAAQPTRDIGSTLAQFRPAAAPVAPARVAHHVEPTKRVQFAETAMVKTVDGSPIAMAARMRVDLEALSASQCLTEHGDRLPSSTIKNQLLMCLNLNSDEALTSEGSEALLRKAFFRADALPRNAHCGPGDYSYDVLSAFLTVIEQKRPALLTAD